MTARWLAICAIASACGGAAAPPPVVVAVSRPVVVEPEAEPMPEPEPVPIAAPPVVTEPVVARPPCPDEPRDNRRLPDHVVQLVELADAMTVVDLGSGSGYLLCRLSRAVGPRGRVVATEVGKHAVRALTRRAAHEQLANVEVIQAPAADVGIAAGTADRIVLVNVWHHLWNRKHYATRVARALAPAGKVVVVDFKPRGGHGIAPERVIAELAAGGIDGALVTEELPDQFVIVGSLRK